MDPLPRLLHLPHLLTPLRILPKVQARLSEQIGSHSRDGQPSLGSDDDSPPHERLDETDFLGRLVEDGGRPVAVGADSLEEGVALPHEAVVARLEHHAVAVKRSGGEVAAVVRVRSDGRAIGEGIDGRVSRGDFVLRHRLFLAFPPRRVHLDLLLLAFALALRGDDALLLRQPGLLLLETKTALPRSVEAASRVVEPEEKEDAVERAEEEGEKVGNVVGDGVVEWEAVEVGREVKPGVAHTHQVHIGVVTRRIPGARSRGLVGAPDLSRQPQLLVDVALAGREDELDLATVLTVKDERFLEAAREVERRAKGERPGDRSSPANGARRELEVVASVEILRRDVADVVELERPLAALEVIDDEAGQPEERESLRRGGVTFEDGFLGGGGSDCCCYFVRGWEEREVEDEGGRDESASRRARRRLRVEEVSNDVCSEDCETSVYILGILPSAVASDGVCCSVL